MAGDLFQDLPPPSAAQSQQLQSSTVIIKEESSPKPPPQAPPPALKSALKRTKPSSEDTSKPTEAAAPEKKRLRFKTTTDASEKQVIEAMQKIASHIKNPSKFSKASKLAIQLIQAGSVKPTTSDYFFAVLEGAMSSPTACNEASLRADYHALFSAARDVIECLNKKQKNLLTSWTIRAVVVNDLFTDDSFVFLQTVPQAYKSHIREILEPPPVVLQSNANHRKPLVKASGRIKEAISSLPAAASDDDTEETAALNDRTDVVNADGESYKDSFSGSRPEGQKEEPDPFGLDALIPSTAKKDEKAKGKKEVLTKNRKEEEEETKRFLKLQREALISCLEIAARRYKTPWCQTVIDILVKHAFDNISRFTTQQRDAIEKLWASIREQQTHRKQGKSVSGKLDVNAFEWLQQKYANEKISIRHSVGSSGERHCEQWLG